MKTLFSRRNTRYTASVMLFVWLMALGAGIANACLLSDAHGHSGSVQQVQATAHTEADEHAPDPDQAICLTVCAAEQTAAIKVKPFDNAADSQSALVVWVPALTVAHVDLDDRPTPLAVQTWREPPVSIRFLRLTL
ncbi:hypothetical protein PMI15_00472 [Polaromonas sp. CF318]|uniref:hypothetical protein n=1 Tax=Polaromonas sp. CF318 TaxID=1144318 RepID=UPI0002713511|nr:hypothetical protein [Polaromonas sp. CF318]EJL89859.1 hypothetical protein PMI15_00472 [Polaromonas sp. CF318]